MADFSINLDENSTSLNITKDIYIRILSKALTQTQKDILDLEGALPVEDFDTIQSIAHRLKGDYDNMRIKVLSGIARQINDISKTSKDKKAIEELLNEFKAFFEQLQSFINSQGANNG